MIRVRHYTRVSSMRKILADQKIVARDQNKVFVERADARKLSPRVAESKYGLDKGKGNAYIEFYVRPEELRQKFNRVIKFDEWYLDGDADLTDRSAEAFFNF